MPAPLGQSLYSPAAVRPITIFTSQLDFCLLLLLLLLQENPQMLLNLAESNMEDSAEYGEVRGRLKL